MSIFITPNQNLQHQSSSILKNIIHKSKDLNVNLAMNWIKEKIEYHVLTLHFTSKGSHVGNKYFELYCSLPETIFIWPYKWDRTKCAIKTKNPSKIKFFFSFLLFLQHVFLYGYELNEFSGIQSYPQSISIFILHINILFMDTMAVYVWFNILATTTMVDAYSALLRFDSSLTGNVTDSN